MTYHAPPTARIGHVHLKVANLERAIAFYSGVLGFGISARYGTQAAFLAAGDYHHHIGLNTWESAGATAPPAGHTGLYHTAFLFPDRAALATTVKRVLRRAFSLMAKPTTLSARRSICAIQTKTGWNCIGTVQRPSGPMTRPAHFRWATSPWI